MYVSASAYISSSSLAPGCMKITPLVIRNKDRKSTRLNSSHSQISYAVFCLKKKKTTAILPSKSSIKYPLYFNLRQTTYQPSLPSLSLSIVHTACSYNGLSVPCHISSTHSTY